MRGGRLLIGLLVLACAVPAAGAAMPVGDPDIAALQVGLRARNLYDGSIDGLVGPGTRAAAAALGRQAGLSVRDPLQVRPALGAYGAASLGSRTLGVGMSGWDVAAFQFLLAWHGFPSGELDGRFTAETQAALLRFQRWAGLPPAGVAGPLTLGALQTAPPRSPVSLAWPLRFPVGDGFGPRGGRFHAGIDIVAPVGTPVAAAAAGRVVYADWRGGGYGNEVTIAHGGGVRTLYAHLSRVDVAVGTRVAEGEQVGLVGATGDATGPHLHFEVRVRGAAVDPLSALTR